MLSVSFSRSVDGDDGTTTIARSAIVSSLRNIWCENRRKNLASRARGHYDEKQMPELQDPSSSSASKHDFTELLDSIKTPPPKSRNARQGLPTEYRMRHDAHYVEELATHANDTPSEAATAAETLPMPAALRDLCQEFEGLASCFNLIEHSARPLRERLGLSLAKIGVQRSIRYAQHLRILLEEPHPLLRELRLDEEIRHAFDDLTEELRLTESMLSIDVAASPLPIRADISLLRTALRACAGAGIALIERGGVAATLHVSVFTAGDLVHCEFRQDAYEMESQEIASLFRLQSSDRAPGRAIAVALHAARRIAQLHGGQLQAKRTGSGGCALLFSFQKSAGSTPPLSSS
jgi:hypothetical protein